MNIAERRLPQDGRIQRVIAGRPIDMRVSTLPTQFGESVVLRVLDRSTVNLELETLGMPDYIYNYICEVIEKPNGIFIVTGPDGFRKTTTLYSCLRKINTIDSKLLTAEDPVEYDIDGIMQVPVNEAIGLTFARVLRAFLRQDPDRIMVGETRDVETAQIADPGIAHRPPGFHHPAHERLHGAVTRLMDMGVEPFLISAALEAVLGQRLIRRICKGCRTAYEPTEAVLDQLGLSPYDIGDKNFYYGKGCDACNNTGYKGPQRHLRTDENHRPDPRIGQQRAPGVVLRQKAIELGMTPFVKTACAASTMATPPSKKLSSIHNLRIAFPVSSGGHMCVTVLSRDREPCTHGLHYSPHSFQAPQRTHHRLDLMD
jgi:type IV pilus assembly protein PilB